jgi:hypothetical protein
MNGDIMGFSGNYNRYFEHLTETTNEWHPFYSTTLATGTRLYRYDVAISAKRVSNGDSSVWSRVFAVKREGSGDLDLVGSSGLTLDLTVVERDAGATLWNSRVRVDGGDIYIEGYAGSTSGDYDVEWAADIVGYGFQTVPE